MKKIDIISKQQEAYFADAIKGQEEYGLLDEAHKIVKVMIDDKEVEFEVVLRLKSIPKKYGKLAIVIEDKVRSLRQ